ncbi:unnamed protein product (macronuclear) [Paramecium tetraurelia]|uniref:Uncharacterized protein n=1 Tax=Paramecium tetraurelia TaxID=5888 RepID=A0C244_PARTE|nr:uncharacterized protein GSPATT00034338001 [Paramecium tetraurelia]CAK64861.1 unnamed protein product [Paramecium tetraurelia]|eukprot:XP_001432258.1 hypothetical protein (macronuclear) [Paramecium tetraurelia strain d4-2]
MATTIVLSQEFVTFHKGVCGCEELNEKECEAESDWMQGRCNIEKGKCVTRKCENINNINLCIYLGCFVKKNKCYKPKRCSEQTEDECSELFNRDCAYDSSQKKCLSFTEPSSDESIPKCAERSVDDCYVAREGLCYVKDGKCQELTTCEEVKLDALCFKAYPACFMQPTISCDTNHKCESIFSTRCVPRKQKINGDQFLLCREQEDGKCVNFDPTQENEETCYQKSELFYHWDGKSCVKCKGWQISAQKITIFIFIALILNHI